MQGFISMFLVYTLFIGSSDRGNNNAKDNNPILSNQGDLDSDIRVLNHEEKLSLSIDILTRIEKERIYEEELKSIQSKLEELAIYEAREEEEREQRSILLSKILHEQANQKEAKEVRFDKTRVMAVIDEEEEEEIPRKKKPIYAHNYR